ncbi:exodeoxyribonuclease VII large subunit [Sulfurimonas aquatica]|uniref:Exodeoxyribonuclease 7 large subunit n=1 Tax=Sulfurimonas aquatica TaxID=2672570 RepID=A0A975AZ66_9BACT|nr:exodeoxyribonuclease VII large subunit [Sulfurimonas aquatica]QSZ41297.1 exodeoxyribonuclease VII large subunit [Sulfurimonas aquatica]
MNTLSVSALNEQIKGLLEESFSRIFVEGELSRITFHNSGHVYFTLKDSSSTLSAVMFRGNASKLKFQLKEGLKVVVDGAITLYKPRGSYQINCFSIEPAGHGALALAFEQLKEKLALKGYFSSDLKKQLPKFPSRLALITSATGAALQDMLRVANGRYRLLEIDIYDVLVQGQNAALEISNAIRNADNKNYDLMVIGRGGGSIEDLWAFNEEIVADTIFNAATPIVSAVGHEIDWVISDFVSDVRAPTPSAAMEIVLPDTNELYQYLDSISSQMTQILKQKIYNKNQELEHLRKSYAQHSVEKKMMNKKEEITKLTEAYSQAVSYKFQNFAREVEYIKSNYPQAINSKLTQAKSQIEHIRKMFESNHPKLKSKRGFAQVSKDEKVIDIADLKVDEIFEVQSDTIAISAKVIKKEKII